MSENPSVVEREKDIERFLGSTVPRYLTYAVLALAFGLIALISWAICNGVDFLEDPFYMKYQLITCTVFLCEYFYRLIISTEKKRYFFWALPFLFISIPYLNIIANLGISVPRDLLVYLCFIPILRGLFALIMVVTYVADSLVTTVFASYVVVLVPVVYMSGLIFYIAEYSVNSAVKNFWYAQWWAGMSVTTIGCYINPVTNTGMILGLMLSLLGIVMFPLFTVYLGEVIRIYSHKPADKAQS